MIPFARLGLIFLIASTLPAQERMFNLKDYRIGVSVTPPPPPGSASPQVTFHIRYAPTGRENTIAVANYTQSVETVFLPEPGKLVAIGHLAGGGGEVMSVIDLGASRLADTVWAWQPAMSHNLRYGAYQFRYPPHGLPAFRNAVLLLYDFRLSPEAIPGGRRDSPAERGFILYPEQNRVQGKYALPSRKPGAEYVFSSPIVWSENGDRIALVDAYEGVANCVVVSIAKSPTQPVVTRWAVHATLFLEDRFNGMVPDEYKGVSAVLLSKLEFVNGGTALEMTSARGGPFARKTVRLSLDDGSESVVSAPAVQAHVEVPPGTPFIRVGGAVLERKLLHKVEPADQAKEGLVEFEALVDPEGRVVKTVPLHGTAELIAAAEKAVRQWVYQPTLLNGRRVSVVTTIEVAFHAKK